MTRLLVSVRDEIEARTALRGGADLIDVKEPDRGSLGSADPAMWRQVAAAVASRVPVSAALGESFGEHSAAALHACGDALQYAKLGLAGAANVADWWRSWQVLLDDFPAHITRVAVAYADWQAAQSPPPDEVLRRATEAGCSVLLIDTLMKDRGRLLDHLPIDELAGLVGETREAGLRIVLAGSLTEQAIRALVPLTPDFIAVRGAACDGSRTGSIVERRVRSLRALLSQRAGSAHHPATGAV